MKIDSKLFIITFLKTIGTIILFLTNFFLLVSFMWAFWFIPDDKFKGMAMVASVIFFVLEYSFIKAIKQP